MMTRNFKIEIFSNLEDVAQRWNDLERAGQATPFQSLTWCRTLYEHIGRAQNAVPCVVVVRDTRLDQDILLLPFCLCDDDGGRRKISFFDLGVSDYSAPVVAASTMPDAAAMRLLWPLILKELPKADYLQFSKAPEKIGTLPNPLIDMVEPGTSNMKSYGLQLPENWEDYRPHVLSRGTRKSIRLKSNKLNRAGKVVFIQGDTAQQAENIFEVLLRQRRARFADLGRREILNEASYVSFYRAILIDNYPDTLGQITALTVDGEIIAVLYGLIYKGGYFMLLSSFEGGDWGRYSPGLLITEAMMQWLHARDITYYDFTIGSEPYKQQLGGVEHELYEDMIPFSLAGRYLAGVSSAKRTLKTLLGKT